MVLLSQNAFLKISMFSSALADRCYCYLEISRCCEVMATVSDVRWWWWTEKPALQSLSSAGSCLRMCLQKSRAHSDSPLPFSPKLFHLHFYPTFSLWNLGQRTWLYPPQTPFCLLQHGGQIVFFSPGKHWLVQGQPVSDMAGQVF